MLDMERARMTAEDYRQGNARCDHNPNFMTWRALEHWRELRMEEAGQLLATMLDVVRQSETRQTDASGRPLTGEDYFAQIRAAVQAHALSIESGAETSDEEMSDDPFLLDEEDEEADLHCVLCSTLPGNRMNFIMEPQGRWAGLAPNDRIVCDMCYRDDMGEVHSFF